ADFFGFDWGNSTGTLRWNHLFSDKLFSNFSLIYTNYNFKILGEIGPATFKWNSFINDASFKADFTLYANAKHTLQWGLQTTHHNFNPGIIEISIDDAFSQTTELSVNNGLEHGIYVSDEIAVSNKWLVTAGARVSAFQNIGPDKIYNYNKTNPIA